MHQYRSSKRISLRLRNRSLVPSIDHSWTDRINDAPYLLGSSYRKKEYTYTEAQRTNFELNGSSLLCRRLRSFPCSYYPYDSKDQNTNPSDNYSPLETVAALYTTIPSFSSLSNPCVASSSSSPDVCHTTVSIFPSSFHHVPTHISTVPSLRLSRISKFSNRTPSYPFMTISSTPFSTSTARYSSKSVSPSSTSPLITDSSVAPPPPPFPTITITSPQYHALQIRFQRIRTLLAENRNISTNDIASILEDSIASGQLSFAVDTVETLAVFEQQQTNNPSFSSLITPDHIQHVLAAAALQRDIASSDRIMRIAFASPHTRLDERVATIYTYLVAGMEQPDHQRGFALCTVLEETTLVPYAAYLNAVQKNHGIQGLMSTLAYANKLQPSLSLRAWLTILQSIKQARPEDLKAIFHTILRIAKDECRKVNSTNPSSMNDNLTVSPSSSPPKSNEVSRKEKFVYGIIYDIYIDALLAHGLLIDATKECRTALKYHYRLLSGPSHIANGCLTRIKGLPPGARDRRTFLDISLDMTTYTLESMENYGIEDYAEIMESIYKLTGTTPAATTNIDLSELLKRCMEEEWWTKVMNVTRLILQQTERNMHTAYENQTSRSGGYMTSNGAEKDKTTHTILIGRKMIESILGGLVRAGKIIETDELFTRMQDLGKLRHLPGSDLLRPRDHAYNIMIKFYARYRNPAKAKVILNEMQRLGYQPEPSALAALATLRNEIHNEQNEKTVSTKSVSPVPDTLSTSSVSSSPSATIAPLLSVPELDNLVHQLIDARATSLIRTNVRRSTSDIVAYNNILVGYFRNQVPAKALQFIYQLQSLNLFYRLDTLRILFQGLLLSGNPGLHGIGINDIDKVWRSKGGIESVGNLSVPLPSSLPGLRTRTITIPRTRRTENNDEEFLACDLAPIANILAEYRTALYASFGSKSSSTDNGEGTDESWSDTLEHGHESRAVVRIIQTNPALYPLLSSTISLYPLLYLLGTLRLRTTTGSIMHPWMEYKVVHAASIETTVIEDSRTRDKRTSFSNDELNPSDALLRNPASLNNVFQIVDTNNAEHRSQNLNDYLHYLPSLIQPLITAVQASRSHTNNNGNVNPNQGNSNLVTSKDLSTTCSDLLRTALGSTLPVRSLQSVLLLYGSGVFLNTLTISSRLSTLLPKLRIIDVRGIDPDVATVFVQLILSSVLEQAIRTLHYHNDSKNAINLHYVPLNSIGFLTGPANSRTTVRIMNALTRILPSGTRVDETNVPVSVSIPSSPVPSPGDRSSPSSSAPGQTNHTNEIIPSVPSVSTQLRAIVINSTVLEEWIIMERNRIRTLMNEPCLDILTFRGSRPRDTTTSSTSEKGTVEIEQDFLSDNPSGSRKNGSSPVGREPGHDSLSRAFDILRSRLSSSK